LKNRIEILRGMMKEEGIVNLFINSMSDIYYLTGFTGSTAYLFVTPENAVFMTDGRYTEQAKSELGEGIETIIVNNYQTALQDFVAEAKEIHVTYSCGLSEYEQIADRITKFDIDRKKLIQSLRMVKDEGELAEMRKMYVMAKDAFDRSLDAFRPDVAEVMWAAELEKQMKVLGAKTPSFETIVASGKRGAMPHGKASMKIVEKGDAVVVDFGCKKEYCSDVTRMVTLGANAEHDKVIGIVYDALQKAKDGVKAGLKCSDIDKIARDHIESKGYGDFFNHGLGHSVGIDVHEDPRFSFKDDTILKENMVLTIEPGIYLPDNFGVRLEDTIVVEKDGCENLTAVFDKYEFKL
jgi:Xaa-Pro aminopeptidase